MKLLVATAAPIFVALSACATDGARGAAAPVVDVPFDSSRNQVEIAATFAGRPAVFLVDTGLNPSGIGIGTVQRAGIAIDEKTRFELSGVGSSTVYGYDATINGLEIGGVSFSGIEAVADTGPLFTRQDRQLDGILGYSFLNDKVVLFDYPERRFRILRSAGDASPFARRCERKFDMPLRTAGDDTIPVIYNFDFGGFTGPASIDTGSSLGITFYPATAERLATRLQEIGKVAVTGARGAASRSKVKVAGGMGFGPFRQTDFEATVGRSPQDGDPRLANLGNRFFMDLGVKLLFDYPSRTVTVFGSCEGAAS